MKNIKNFLCLTFMLVISFMSFAGCTPDEETPPVEPSEVIISLTEAKSMVVDSLESSTNNTQLLNNGQTIVGNRNIFVKVKNAEVNIQGDFDFDDSISGYVQRTTSSWTKYSLQSGDLYGYYDGSNAYTKNNDSNEKSTFEDSYFGVILQSMDCIYVDLLFIEDAWVTIYKDSVTKTTKDYGFSLTMSVDMPKYVDFVMAKCGELGLGAEGLFGEGDYLQRNKDEGSVQLEIKFDKFFNVTGLDMTINSLGSANGEISMNETKITITKYSEEINPPSWFNASNYE